MQKWLICFAIDVRTGAKLDAINSWNCSLRKCVEMAITKLKMNNKIMDSMQLIFLLLSVWTDKKQFDSIAIDD